MLRILIDRDDADPPFLQVRSQIEAAVGSGRLPVGARLPAVRNLAERLGLAPGTVARAYRELEACGLVDTRGRHGTFVSDPKGDRARHQRQLAELARSYAQTAVRFGIRPAVAVDLVDQALRDSEARNSRSPG